MPVPSCRAVVVSLVAIVSSGLAVAPAAAVDGVIEINQARALAGGVTAVDTPGFPVTIDANGSYRLTGNLTVDANTTAIDVTGAAMRVTIDLNGFAILGPVTCASFPCSSTGPGRGIGRSGIVANDSTVRVLNGAIRGMGATCISATPGIVDVDSVEVQDCAGYGITGGAYSRVLDSTASRDYSGGLLLGPYSSVEGSTVANAGSIGINAGPGSVVARNRSSANGAFGIFADDGSTISGNTVTSNGTEGIVAGGGCTVQDNTVRSNAGLGIDFAGKGGYGGNVITLNNGGNANTQVGGGSLAVEIGINVCATDTVCP